MCERYESARLLHGRQWPMKGKLYDNIFLHYKVIRYTIFTIDKYNSAASSGLVRGRGQNKRRPSNLSRIGEARTEGVEGNWLDGGVVAVSRFCHQLSAGGGGDHVQDWRWSLQREGEKRGLETPSIVIKNPFENRNNFLEFTCVVRNNAHCFEDTEVFQQPPWLPPSL